jgi:hypothetical protein
MPQAALAFLPAQGGAGTKDRAAAGRISSGLHSVSLSCLSTALTAVLQAKTKAGASSSSTRRPSNPQHLFSLASVLVAAAAETAGPFLSPSPEAEASALLVDILHKTSGRKAASVSSGGGGGSGGGGKRKTTRQGGSGSSSGSGSGSSESDCSDDEDDDISAAGAAGPSGGAGDSDGLSVNNRSIRSVAVAALSALIASEAAVEEEEMAAGGGASAPQSPKTPTAGSSSGALASHQAHQQFILPAALTHLVYRCAAVIDNENQQQQQQQRQQQHHQANAKRLESPLPAGQLSLLLSFWGLVCDAVQFRSGRCFSVFSSHCLCLP